MKHYYASVYSKVVSAGWFSDLYEFFPDLIILSVLHRFLNLLNEGNIVMDT